MSREDAIVAADAVLSLDAADLNVFLERVSTDPEIWQRVSTSVEVLSWIRSGHARLFVRNGLVHEFARADVAGGIIVYACGTRAEIDAARVETAFRSAEGHALDAANGYFAPSWNAIDLGTPPPKACAACLTAIDRSLDRSRA